jgi:hypothetical protein
MCTPVRARIAGISAASLKAEYGSGKSGLSMLRERVLANGIPLLVLLLAVLSLQQWGDRLPPRLQRLAERPTWL